jgi:DNA-binding response OmpR family regulator
MDPEVKIMAAGASGLDFEVVTLAEVPHGDVATRGHGRLPVVMVVDDEKLIADTLSMILRKNGYTVLTAYNGESALELAGRISPEVLITDVVMLPGMNGVQLAIEVVRSSTDCRVLLFSGQARTLDLLSDARKEGHQFTLLAKPLHPLQLLDRVRECVRSRESSGMRLQDS